MIRRQGNPRNKASVSFEMFHEFNKVVDLLPELDVAVH